MLTIRSIKGLCFFFGGWAGLELESVKIIYSSMVMPKVYCLTRKTAEKACTIEIKARTDPCPQRGLAHDHTAHRLQTARIPPAGTCLVPRSP